MNVNGLIIDFFNHAFPKAADSNYFWDHYFMKIMKSDVSEKCNEHFQPDTQRPKTPKTLQLSNFAA